MKQSEMLVYTFSQINKKKEAEVRTAIENKNGYMLLDWMSSNISSLDNSRSNTRPIGSLEVERVANPRCERSGRALEIVLYIF